MDTKVANNPTCRLDIPRELRKKMLELIANLKREGASLNVSDLAVEAIGIYLGKSLTIREKDRMVQKYYDKEAVFRMISKAKSTAEVSELMRRIVNKERKNKRKNDCKATKEC